MINGSLTRHIYFSFLARLNYFGTEGSLFIIHRKEKDMSNISVTILKRAKYNLH